MTCKHAVAFLLLAVLGCKSSGERARLAGEDKILAEVNGSHITLAEVEQAARSMFGADASKMDDGAKRKLLESLVHSRAIAQAREKEMSAVELAEVELQVRAHREQLLVQQYLAKHTGPRTLDPDLARRYYDENTSRFGGATVRSYELAFAPAIGGASAQQAKLLATLGKADQEGDWSAWATRIASEGQTISVRRGDDSDAVLHPKLRQWIAQVKTGETSKPTIIEGAAYVVRVTSERVTPPKPFAEVRDEIAKALAPESVREAVREASAQVLKSTEVAYR
jgi:hypothetical protein